MTLVEFLIGASIGVLVVAATAELSVFSSRSFAGMYNYVDLNDSSKLALDRITKQIRQAKSLKKYKPDTLTFVDFDGKDLQFKYDDKKQTLTQHKGGQPDVVLLTGCRDLQFSIFQRNPIGGTYDQYPAADESTCKLVQIQWTCARVLLGVTNSTIAQSAKVVIRNE